MPLNEAQLNTPEETKHLNFFRRVELPRFTQLFVMYRIRANELE
jgi:hypothetical protein